MVMANVMITMVMMIIMAIIIILCGNLIIISQYYAILNIHVLYMYNSVVEKV